MLIGMNFDLEPWAALPVAAIPDALQAAGFTESAQLGSVRLFAHPGHNIMLRLSADVNAERAFSALCRDHADNPHLPQIFAQHELAGEPPAMLSVTEKLLTLAELPPPLHSVVGGFARGLATLIEGHASHDDVHVHMMKNPAVAEVTQRLLDALEDGFSADDDQCLFLQGTFAQSATPSIEDWYPDNILYRPKQTRGFDLVFASPLESRNLSGTMAHARRACELRALRARLDGLCPAPDIKKTPPAAPGPSSPV